MWKIEEVMLWDLDKGYRVSPCRKYQIWIDPSATIYPGVTMGTVCIEEGVVVGPDAKLGHHSHLLRGSHVEAGASVPAWYTVGVGQTYRKRGSDLPATPSATATDGEDE